MRKNSFQWDEWNTDKVQKRISVYESESVFSDPDAVVVEDDKHSQDEERYNIIGKSHSGNYLYVTFTLRNEEIRIISARKAKDKEKQKFGYPDR